MIEAGAEVGHRHVISVLLSSLLLLPTPSHPTLPVGGKLATFLPAADRQKTVINLVGSIDWDG